MVRHLVIDPGSTSVTKKSGWFAVSADLDLAALLDLARKEVSLSRSAKDNIADDVAHQTVLELFEKGLLADHPNPKALVVQAVRWRGIDAQRRWNRAEQHPDLSEVGDNRVLIPEAWNITPSARVANATAVREALAKLGAIDRLILWRHDVEGVPYHEIAEELALAPGTVRNRAAAARKRLRSHMGG